LIRHIVGAALLATGLVGPITGSSFAGGEQCGGASWYSLPGNTTASGETMNPNAMTAAHKTLPFGTQVKVTDQRTGNAILVTINDRGPFIRGRIIDLSKAAAGELGFRRRGHTEVCIVQV
jgi:rare lipoprotein A